MFKFLKIVHMGEGKLVKQIFLGQPTMKSRVTSFRAGASFCFVIIIFWSLTLRIKV